MGTGFYGSNDPTNSVKALKEQLFLQTVTVNNVESYSYMISEVLLQCDHVS